MALRRMAGDQKHTNNGSSHPRHARIVSSSDGESSPLCMCSFARERRSSSPWKLFLRRLRSSTRSFSFLCTVLPERCKSLPSSTGKPVATRPHLRSKCSTAKSSISSQCMPASIAASATRWGEGTGAVFNWFRLRLEIAVLMSSNRWSWKPVRLPSSRHSTLGTAKWFGNLHQTSSSQHKQTFGGWKSQCLICFWTCYHQRLERMYLVRKPCQATMVSRGTSQHPVHPGIRLKKTAHWAALQQ